MTTLTRDIVTGALRHLRIIDGNENASGEDAAIALERLNDMMHAWALSGVDLYHQDLELTDPFPMEDKYREGVKAMLAVSAMNDFSHSNISPTVVEMAVGAWAKLLEEYAGPDKAEFDLALTHMPAELWRTGTQ